MTALGLSGCLILVLIAYWFITRTVLPAAVYVVALICCVGALALTGLDGKRRVS
jgi:hypothetical protein